MAKTKVPGGYISDEAITVSHLHSSHGITTNNIGVDYHEKLDEPNEHGWANAYMLRYERLVPVLTEALKECYSKIDALETRITELEG